ncbi:MAG TPA: ABC transporter permease [Oscillospiraceae bacterium]|jgi:simple sugar transport system permease protein|nr:ABC transporter permease [Oscillospiraceae bacterium]HQQ89021.1 ABC transporter permease [Oscillospiraceae bacterium]HRW56303.1 ABC transporter permease [Oscillospiraceae bacterium]
MKRIGTALRKAFVFLLGDEKRQRISIPLFSILISLIVGAVVYLILEVSPWDALLSYLRGCGLWPKLKYAGSKSIFTDFMSFLDAWTPMIFAALAVAVAAKAGLFNIGVSGQMLISGFIATVLVGYSALPAYLAKPIVLVIGLIVGAAAGSIIGLLKYRFNINEVVSAIMLNYIFNYVISFFIYYKYVDPVSRQSKYVTDASRLTLQNVAIGDIKTVLPLAFPLAVLMAFAVRFFLSRTKTGFEMKTVGLNRKAAKFAGIHVGKSIVLAMTLSGALSGLAGVSYYLGYFSSIQPRVLISTGFDAIAVSLLGNSDPVGILASSFLITILSKGSTYMSSSVGVDQDIASLIIGIILLFSACGAFIRYRWTKEKERLDEASGKAERSERV